MKNTIIFIVLSLSLMSSAPAQNTSNNLDKSIKEKTDLNNNINLSEKNQPLDESELKSNEHIQIKQIDKRNLEVVKKDSESKFIPTTDYDENSDGFHKFELFTGYSGASLYSSEFEPVEHGFNVAGVYNFHRYMGIKIDVSGTFKNFESEFIAFQTPDGFGQTIGSFSGNHSLYNVTGGIQFKDNSTTGRLKPFAHTLVGYANHFDSINPRCPSIAGCSPIGADFNFGGTSVILGGGLDIKINRYIDLRVIQGDWNPIVYSYKSSLLNSEQSSVYSNFRYSTGIVFKF